MSITAILQTLDLGEIQLPGVLIGPNKVPGMTMGQVARLLGHNVTNASRAYSRVVNTIYPRTKVRGLAGTHNCLDLIQVGLILSHFKDQPRAQQILSQLPRHNSDFGKRMGNYGQSRRNDL